MNTFFKMLKTIEELSSEKVLSKDKDLILRKLIAFVESGVCTDSQIEKFIMKNFRLSSVKITEEWNKKINHQRLTYRLQNVNQFIPVNF